MTLTFRVGRSRLFDIFIKICSKVSSFDMTRIGPYIHRITTTNHDISIGPMYFKAVIFDLDLESQQKKWQEPFLKSKREYKHFGV